MDLNEHLFRHESSRMVAALTRIFGVHNLALAEDVVQGDFCRAMQVWKVRGLPDAEFAPRLSAVRRALYLLFNEGYHGASAESAVRVELCREAIRLTVLLLDYPPAATPETHALAALMCLHAARIPARVDASGDLNPLLDQDRSRWDTELTAQGLAHLDRSATGRELTAYHVEAGIAAMHAAAPSVADTDWSSIV